jgi:hypothetical protein
MDAIVLVVKCCSVICVDAPKTTAEMLAVQSGGNGSVFTDKYIED